MENRISNDTRASKHLTAVMTLMVLTALYYNWYRYPFQINSTETSLTYEDTPLFLQVGKYILILIMYLYLAVFRIVYRQPLVSSNPLYAFSYLYLACIPIIYGVLIPNGTFVQAGIFVVISVLLHLYSRSSLDLTRLCRIISFSVYAGIVVNIIQVVLFVVWKRLPALAIEESIVIRFGSFMDDPNGFGILLALFMGFSLYYYAGFRRIAIMTALVISLFLTQSLTAFIAVSLAFFIYGVLFIRRYLYALLASVLLLLVPMVVANVYMDTIRSYLEYRQGSIEGHAESLESLGGMSVLTVFGVDPSEMFGESGYMNILANFGVIYTMLFLAMGVATVIILRRLMVTSSQRPHRALVGGFLCYVLATYIGCINLPFEKVFPINLLLFVFMGLATSTILGNSIKLEDSATCQN